MFKKILATIVMGIFVMTAATAYPIDLQIGMEIETVLNREVRLENLGIDADLTEQYYDITLEIKPADWLTITPKVGINAAQANINTNAGDIELNSGIGWNIGIDVEADVYSLVLNDVNYVDFSLIGGYRFSRVDLDEIDFAGLTINNPIETIITTHAWELGGKVSRELKEFVGFSLRPYVGMVYSDLRGDANVNLSLINLDEDISAIHNFGLRTGLTAEPIKDFIVALDVKFVDQTALIVSASYKF